MTRTIPTGLATGLAALALLALGACSGAGDGTPAVTAASPTQASSAAPPDGSETNRSPGTAAGPGGDCDLLSVTEIEQAFGNKLRVKRVSGSGTRGSGCTVSIAVYADGRSISLGLMLLVFDGEAPVTAAEVAAGVQSLARLALERS